MVPATMPELSLGSILCCLLVCVDGEIVRCVIRICQMLSYIAECWFIPRDPRTAPALNRPPSPRTRFIAWRCLDSCKYFYGIYKILLNINLFFEIFVKTKLPFALLEFDPRLQV